MSLFHLRGLKHLPQNVPSVPYMEHLVKFNLDLRNRRYIKSPKVSCLGMNPRLGWKPDLEESYLPEYSDYEATKFTQGT